MESLTFAAAAAIAATDSEDDHGFSTCFICNKGIVPQEYGSADCSSSLSVLASEVWINNFFGRLLRFVDDDDSLLEYLNECYCSECQQILSTVTSIYQELDKLNGQLLDIKLSAERQIRRSYELRNSNNKLKTFLGDQGQPVGAAGDGARKGKGSSDKSHRQCLQRSILKKVAASLQQEVPESFKSVSQSPSRTAQNFEPVSGTRTNPFVKLSRMPVLEGFLKSHAHSGRAGQDFLSSRNPSSARSKSNRDIETDWNLATSTTNQNLKPTPTGMQTEEHEKLDNHGERKRVRKKRQILRNPSSSTLSQKKPNRNHHTSSNPSPSPIIATPTTSRAENFKIEQHEPPCPLLNEPEEIVMDFNTITIPLIKEEEEDDDGKSELFVLGLDDNASSDQSGIDMTQPNSNAPGVGGGMVFKCAECPKVLVSKSGLKHHVRRHHHNLIIGPPNLGLKSLTLTCPICSKKLSSELQYKHHVAAHNSNQKPPYPCTNCSRAYFHLAQLKKHEKTVHEPNLDSASSSAGTTRTACTICGNNVALINYRAHLRTHSAGTKPYQCSQCDRWFTNKTDLNNHEAYVHTGEKRHQCATCGLRFTCRSNYVRHIRIHQPPAFFCESCGKGFKRKEHLKEHANLHTGALPFRCVVCGRRYAARELLNHHLVEDHTTEQLEQRKRRMRVNKKINEKKQPKVATAKPLVS